MARYKWIVYLITPLLFSCEKSAKDGDQFYQVALGDIVYQSAWQGFFEARNKKEIFAPDVEDQYTTVASVLKDGQQVEQGQIVLKFDPSLKQQELMIAKAKLEIAEAHLVSVREELKLKELELKGQVIELKGQIDAAALKIKMSGTKISRLEKERLILDKKKAALELLSLQESLKTFKKHELATLNIYELKIKTEASEVDKVGGFIEAMQVRAPASGIIYGPYTRLNFMHSKVAAGSVVRAGDKLLEIPDLSSYDVFVYLRQKDATFLQVGDRVIVYPAIAPEKPLRGVVAEKDKFAISLNERLSLKSSQGHFKEIKFRIELEDHLSDLRPGNMGRVEVALMLKKNVLQVPLSYVAHEDEQYFVKVHKGKKIPVSIGVTSLTHAEITKGLKVGDLLALPK